MVAYISHGASGYGAYPAQGAADPAHRINSGSTDADMQTNAGVDAHSPSGDSAFTYNTSNFTNVFVQKAKVAPTTGDTGFDDLVWYRPDIKNTCCLGPICIPVGFRIDGTIASGGLGSAMAVGDVNGDGIPDLILMAYDPTNQWYDLYVIFGRSDRNFPNPFLVSSLNGTNGFALTGMGAGIPSNSGGSITVADVNGDGISDIIVAWNQGGGGGVSIIFGQSGGTWPSTPTSIHSFTNATLPQVTSLNGGRDWGGCNMFASIGVQIADVNGDGINDVILGVNQYDAGYVIFGHPTQAAIIANTYPNAPTTVWPTNMSTNGCTGSDPRTGGTAASGGLGFKIVFPNNQVYLTGLGDFNHDGIKDLVFGSGNWGGTNYAIVVWGQGPTYSWPATIDTTSTNSSWPANGSAGVSITCDWADCTGGFMGDTGGDVNGDGVDDLIILGSQDVGGGIYGSLFLVYGGSGGSGTPPWPPGWNGGTATNAWSFDTLPASGVSRINNPYGYNGLAGVTLADINGDGKLDMLVAGAVNGIINSYKLIFNNASFGQTYSLGSCTGSSSDCALFDINEAPSIANWSGIATGDVNHDGKTDLVLPLANMSPNSVSDAGSTFIVWGAGSYPAGTFDDSSTYKGQQWVRLDGNYANEYAGSAAATGDFDHDGTTDVAIAAPGNSPEGVSGAGSVYVVFGTTPTKWSTLVVGGATTLEGVVNR